MLSQTDGDGIYDYSKISGTQVAANKNNKSFLRTSQMTVVNDQHSFEVDSNSGRPDQ